MMKNLKNWRKAENAEKMTLFETPTFPQYIKEKSKFRTVDSERGDGVLVMGMWVVLILVIVLALLFDITKGATLKNVQTSMAQQSAEYGISQITSAGTLDDKAVESAIDSYLTLRNNTTTIDGKTYRSEFSQLSAGNRCHTVTVDGVQHEAPYFEATLSKTRGDNSDQILVDIEQATGKARLLTTPRGKYKVLNLTVYDAGSNLWMGVIGSPCQQMRSSVSAIAFGSNEDIEIDGEAGSNR